MDIKVYYATMTGSAADLAERTVSLLMKKGWTAEAIDLGDADPESLTNEKVVLFIVSTWGDGEAPMEAESYLERLQEDKPLHLEGLKYSVLALGDSTYDFFCGCGKSFDERLTFHGAQSITPRIDCDLDYDEPYEKWIEEVMIALS